MLRDPIDRELEQYIIDTIEKNGQATGEGIFGEADWQSYVAEHPNVKKGALYTLLLHNRRLKNTDRNGTSVRIVMNE